jgi:GMP synthase-like glutamine amidotransferase
MKIGLLKCDTVREELLHIAGDCSDFFVTLFSQCAPDLSLKVYDVQLGIYPDAIEECDGYITTGSANSVYDDEPWIHRFRDYVRELHERRTKLVGICFGHQMIAEALDGKCEMAPNGWGVGIKTVRIISKKPWMKPELDSYNLIVSHLDQVSCLPSGAEILGTNEHCPNAMYAVGDHFLGIQGHPEFTTPYADALVLSRIEKIGQPAVDEARESLSNEVHADILTTWIETFFRMR